MEALIKPQKLEIGDTIATISLSGGAAGDLPDWYNVAKSRLNDLFGLNVVETPHSLRGRKYIYENPEASADDFMGALTNPDIKGIFLNVGGDDAIRILPYVDFHVIRDNPKIFLGFSDATVIHFMFLKAGVSSFSGPNVLTTLSEPGLLHPYTEKWMKKVLFHTEPIGNVEPPDEWTNESIDWDNGLNKKRKMIQNHGYELLQGKGKVRGRLIGGTAGPLAFMIKGTCLFPPIQSWENTIIFLDGMTPYAPVSAFVHMLKGLAAAGIFRKAAGILISKPVQDEEHEKIGQVVLKVIRDEEGLHDIPILFNVDFGHTAPICTIPYGAMAEIDCENKAFRILESGVTEKIPNRK